MDLSPDKPLPADPWAHRARSMRCTTCMFFVPKIPSGKSEQNMREDDVPVLGRCRRRSPSMSGYPAVFETDWCGDHKLDENKI